ncbi:trans-sulfuration enzyme family protein [Leptospirillum ferriphilum]|uniref:trans-sulfuration enzyme family protein n=1 Tax=Leptospirillum ferriphilum TaxID=178606 RepID=UPI003EE5CFE2
MNETKKNTPDREPGSPVTRAIHGIPHPDPFRALNPPLYQTSTYTFPDMETVDRVLSGEEEGYVYSRGGNPTVSRFEEVVTLLEKGEASRAFASGMGAISATILHLSRGNRTVHLPVTLYSGTRAFARKFLESWGVPVRWFDPRPEGWLEKLEGTLEKGDGCVFLESPTNPTMDILDLRSLSALCRSKNVPVVVDNTFATPVLQNPLLLGCDLVVHSATKYLGGHGDLLGGVVTGASGTIDALRGAEGSFLGATLSPFNAWLLLRGIKTLSLRMEKHTANARAIASFLAGHPKVRKVFYPGIPSHPGYTIARRQMSSPGGMLSFELSDARAARNFCDRLSLVGIGVSLGDPESLIEHPWSMSHRWIGEEERRAAGVSPGFLRMSVGLEDWEDLVRDLDRALG